MPEYIEATGAEGAKTNLMYVHAMYYAVASRQTNVNMHCALTKTM